MMLTSNYQAIGQNGQQHQYQFEMLSCAFLCNSAYEQQKLWIMYMFIRINLKIAKEQTCNIYISTSNDPSLTNLLWMQQL